MAEGVKGRGRIGMRKQAISLVRKRYGEGVHTLTAPGVCQLVVAVDGEAKVCDLDLVGVGEQDVLRLHAIRVERHPGERGRRRNALSRVQPHKL